MLKDKNVTNIVKELFNSISMLPLLLKNSHVTFETYTMTLLIHLINNLICS